MKSNKKVKKLDIKIGSPDFDLLKTLLKGATYTALSTAGTIIIQSIQDGINIQQSLIIGVSIGCIAGIKNVCKHAFNIDLDLTRLRK